MSLSPVALLRLSFTSLVGSPLRSALSAIGVFMGVAAVSATLQVNNISRTVIGEQLSKREAPQIEIWPSWQGRGRRRQRLKLADLLYLQKRLTTAKLMGTSSWTFFNQVLFHDQTVEPDIQAVSLQFLATTGRKKLAGRWFTQADFDNYRPVVIIDQQLVQLLFSQINPISQTIYMNGKPFTIVGVVQAKQRWEGEDEEGSPGVVWLPFSTYSALSGSTFIGSISIQSPSLEQMEALEIEAKNLLEQRFSEQTFDTWKNVEDIQEQKQTLEMVSRGLLAVGAIALLVGGVGIANITIAAVIERTPEIGLRRAIGATQSDIMWQFILEATLLSLIGGSLAIITVHGITVVVANTFELPYEFNWQTSVLALGAAVGVGVGAVLIPAIRASQLDPVKALRSQ